jgi:hypothetical protein
MTIAGDIVPAANDTYSLGSTGSIWKDIYVGTGSLYLGNTKLSATGTDLIIHGNILPSSNEQFSIGSTGSRIKELHMGPGTIFIGPTGTLGNDDNGIVYAQQGFAAPNYVIGATIPGATGPVGGGVRLTLTGATGPIQYQQLDANGGPTGPVYSLATVGSSESLGPTTICASAYSTADQSFTGGVAENIRHDAVLFSYGITTTTGTTGHFQVPSGGVYKIIPSLQLNPSAAGDMSIWIKVNGSNVANTATFISYKNGDKQVFTTEILLELLANDQVQVWGLTHGQDGLLDYIPSGGTAPDDYPAAPGVITNMYKLR